MSAKRKRTSKEPARDKNRLPKFRYADPSGSLIGETTEPGVTAATVNTERSALAFNLSHNVPAIQNVIGIINRYLFADGIEVTHDQQPLETDKEFQKHLALYYQRYGEDAIRWILCVGVVPVTFSYLDDTKEWIPVVVKPGSGFIRSIYKNHRQKFFYYDYGPQTHNNQVIVLSGFGYDPTIQGQLTSLVNCLLPMETVSSVLLDCATIAEQIRSNPAFVMQMRKDANKPQNRLGIDYGYYAEFDATDETNEERIWRRDDSGFERLRRQNEALYDMYYAPNPLNNVEISDDGRILPQRPWEGNEFHVPDNMELVNQPMPQTRTDLIPFLQFNNSEIYNTLGVPETMATGNLNTRVGNSETVNDLFKTTILWWKRTIAKLLTCSYNVIYGYNDADYILHRFLDTTKTNPLSMTEDQIYAIQKDNNIAINLPIPPFITTQELLMFYQQGALTTEEYCNYLRRRANLGPLDKVPFTPPRAGEEDLQKEKLKADLQAKKPKTSK
jgi:hypothetical protein